MRKDWNNILLSSVGRCPHVTASFYTYPKEASAIN